MSPKQRAKIFVSDPNRGWRSPLSCRSFHYFLNGDSLCGFWGSQKGPFFQRDDNAVGNCSKCRKSLQNLKNQVSRIYPQISNPQRLVA